MTENRELILAAARESLLELGADSLVAQLPKLLPDVLQFHFARYIPSRGVEDRLTARSSFQIPPELEAIKNSSPALHQQIVSLLSLLRARDVSPEIALDELLLHDNSPESAHEIKLSRGDLLNRGISEVPLITGEVLGLSSVCTKTDKSAAHIPMLDFRLPIASDNVPLVRTAATKLGLSHGVILESGRSYHVYGLCSFSVERWWQFMTRALLLAPIIDVRYIAHRLLAGRGVLRITASDAKPQVPRVISVF